MGKVQKNRLREQLAGLFTEAGAAPQLKQQQQQQRQQQPPRPPQ
jgi:hypothetical protein